KLHGFRLLLDDDAGQAAQHDLDPTRGVNPTLRTIHVLEASGHAFDVGAKLAEPPSKALPQVAALRLRQAKPHRPHIQRRLRGAAPTNGPLHGPRNPIGESRSPLRSRAYSLPD